MRASTSTGLAARPFALTSLLLQRSGAFRLALSPPPGRQWPPGSRSGWPTTIEAAGRARSGVVDAPGKPVPPLLVNKMEVVVPAARRRWRSVHRARWRPGRIKSPRVGLPGPARRRGALSPTPTRSTSCCRHGRCKYAQATFAPSKVPRSAIPTNRMGWSLDAGQIYQSHLGELHPTMRWCEAVRRVLLAALELREGRRRREEDHRAT
jgi:hypothetical protein